MNQKHKSLQLQSEMFAANEAWLIFFHPIEGGTYLLIDAATSYIFGTLSADNMFFNKENIVNLLREAWGIKKSSPKKLIIADTNGALATFKEIAEQNKFEIVALPESSFASIVAPIKKTLKMYG
jgi:hypothetical protein